MLPDSLSACFGHGRDEGPALLHGDNTDLIVPDLLEIQDVRTVGRDQNLSLLSSIEQDLCHDLHGGRMDCRLGLFDQDQNGRQA